MLVEVRKKSKGIDVPALGTEVSIYRTRGRASRPRTRQIGRQVENSRNGAPTITDNLSCWLLEIDQNL